MAAKRIQASSVNWGKLADRLTPEHSAELARLKGQNTTYSSMVSQLPAELPKVDWAGLKAKLGDQAPLLTELQKQYDAIKIDFGGVPDKLTKEIDEWTLYNDARTKFQEKKLADGAVVAQKLEVKWEGAPPIEHMDNDTMQKFFPEHAKRDVRSDQHWFYELGGHPVNEPEYTKELLWRNSNYRWRLPRSTPEANVHMHE